MNINEDDGYIDLNAWRTRRLIDALQYAERQFPGVSRDIVSLLDHEGELRVIWSTNHCWPYGPDTMGKAWNFVGETQIVNLHAVELNVEVATT